MSTTVATPASIPNPADLKAAMHNTASFDAASLFVADKAARESAATSLVALAQKSGPSVLISSNFAGATIKALNEFDHKAQGSGGALDWRTKLASQRGAVVATEMKNNSCKLAKWTVQSVLAGADHLKIGYVVLSNTRLHVSESSRLAYGALSSYSWISRVNPRDNTRHVILSTTSTRPADFASQLNVSLANGWGIVRTVADMCMKQPEGKYVLVKDPNKVRVLLEHVLINFRLSPLLRTLVRDEG